jgi:hypothetical protein
MNSVGGNDHATSGNLITYLLGREVGFTLSNATHLGGDGPKTGVLQLSQRHKAIRGASKLSLANPPLGKEIPRRL